MGILFLLLLVSSSIYGSDHLQRFSGNGGIVFSWNERLKSNNPDLGLWLNYSRKYFRASAEATRFTADKYEYFAGSSRPVFYSGKSAGAGLAFSGISILAGYTHELVPARFLFAGLQQNKVHLAFYYRENLREENRYYRIQIAREAQAGIFLGFSRQITGSMTNDSVFFGASFQFRDMNQGILYESIGEDGRYEKQVFFRHIPRLQPQPEKSRKKWKKAAIKFVSVERLLQARFPLNEAVLISKASRTPAEYNRVFQSLPVNKQKKLKMIQWEAGKKSE